MSLAAMRYKSFVWPHNPQVYSIEFQRKMAVNKVPFGRFYLQDLGMTRRVMRGTGEFVGAGAYERMKELGSLFYENTPGVLFHPVWQTTSAYFVGLSVEQEPREDYVRYSFEFWECFADYQETGTLVTREETAGQGTAAGQARYHTVVRGDTLWALAGQYGVSLEELIALNPQIGNPNRIYPGQKVRVA